MKQHLSINFFFYIVTQTEFSFVTLQRSINAKHRQIHAFALAITLSRDNDRSNDRVNGWIRELVRS